MRVVICILALATVALGDPDVVLSDVDACQVLLRKNSMLRENETVRALDGFVGVGWDDLMNRATIPILKNTYKTCKRAQDGMFFVPDDTLVVPILQTSLDRMANVYSNFDEYVKSTTDTISASAGGTFGRFSLSGSFSKTHQEIKDTFFRQQSTMLHSKMIYHAYTLITDEATGLNDGFLGRLQQIADSVAKGVLPQAKHLAELIVRDYGTHVVFKADVGAIIEQETYISSRTISDNTTSMDSLRASASAGFLGIGHVSIDTAHTVTDSDKKVLSDNTHHSRIRTRGGPSVNRLSDDKGIFQIDEVVGFSNEGMPLDTLITPANLPMWDTGRVYTLQQLVYNAIDEYYERNTIRGCTNMTAPNFNYQANFDDGSCQPSNTNYTFDGVYQTCTPINEASGSYEITTTPAWRCGNLSQVNQMTGGYSCQDGYDALPILSITHQFPDRTEQRSYEKCHHKWFKKVCDTVYYNVVMKDRVQLQTFWCRAKSGVEIPQNTGALFGGIYSASTVNVFTGSTSCPGTYMGYHLFADVTICISYAYQDDTKYAIPFGGLFSCQSTQKRCDAGYTQHLVEVFDGCAVYYCVTPEAYLSLEDPVVKRPPFTNVALAASNHSENVILAYYNEEKAVSMPVMDVVQNYTQNYKPSTNGISEWIVFEAEDINKVIEAYMNDTIRHVFRPFQDGTYGDFGLKDEEDRICLFLKFRARIYNFNLDGTDISLELADLSDPKVTLSGYCALPNEVKKISFIEAKWTQNYRKKSLKLSFAEKYEERKPSVLELRWQLAKVIYEEVFEQSESKKPVVFESNSTKIIISAPLHQKFVCKDKLNITLENKKYKPFVLEILPEIDIQPMNTGSGFGSNVYLCERTRSRTLSESFQSRMTIISGVILGLASVGTLVGYSLRRLLLPARQEIYNSLG
ncbi:hypothetical protein FO519_005733 [Halicephalobus sp. NKZ332]|nr:hypothetical protein FO519_005733 [Halicephalobus sp. NKZ332]